MLKYIQTRREKYLLGIIKKLKHRICCLQEVPEVAERTITFMYLTPLPGISYRVHLIGEGSQGYFTTGIIDSGNTNESLVIPDTGLYTVILEIVDAAVGCTITLSNSGILGFKDLSTITSYTAYNRDLSTVTVMNSVTPCA